MRNETKGTQKQQKKYGHLLDKYLYGEAPMTQQEREEEYRKRYGNLAELNYQKPDKKIYDKILKIYDGFEDIRRRRQAEYEQANIMRQERIEREKMEEQERIDKHNAFVNAYLEKKEAERKAEEERREKAEREQRYYDNIQRMIDTEEEVKEMVRKGNAMIEREKQRRKEYEEKKAWYEKQRRG